MSELYDTWAGSTSKAEMSKYSYNELLRLVTELYNSGWTQDGSPRQVTDRLYVEIKEDCATRCRKQGEMKNEMPK